MSEAGRTIDAARARGVDVAADLYVYTAGGTGLEATIPSWAQEGGRAELLKRLADPSTRARLKQEVVTGTPGWSNLVEASGGWSGIVLANARNAANARFEGKTLEEIGKASNRDPVDAAYDLVAEGEGRVMAIYHMMSEADVETALRFPWTSIGSDAGAAATTGGQDPTGLTHPRAYGNFPRVIARYVRERGVLSLEQAIRSASGLPADILRVPERGYIKTGYYADLVILDPKTFRDKATYDQPHQYATGVKHLFVNGRLAIEDGKTTELKLTAPPAGLVAFDVTSNKAAIEPWHKLRFEEAGREVAVIARDPSEPGPGMREGMQITRFITKQAFAPGRHSFLLQADGYQAATCEVEVVADQLTHVRVEMFKL